MDRGILEHYEFLDLSDVDDSERVRLKESLYSQDSSEYLQLPWEPKKSANPDKDWNSESYNDESPLVNGIPEEAASNICSIAPATAAVVTATIIAQSSASANSPTVINNSNNTIHYQHHPHHQINNISSHPAAAAPINPSHVPPARQEMYPAPPQNYMVPFPPQNMYGNGLHGFVNGHFVAQHYSEVDVSNRGGRGRIRGVRPGKRGDFRDQPMPEPGTAAAAAAPPFYAPCIQVYQTMQHPTAQHATGPPLFIQPTFGFSTYSPGQQYFQPPPMNAPEFNMVEDVPEMPGVGVEQSEEAQVYQPMHPMSDEYQQNVMTTVIVNSNVESSSPESSDHKINSNFVNTTQVKITHEKPKQNAASPPAATVAPASTVEAKIITTGVDNSGKVTKTEINVVNGTIDEEKTAEGASQPIVVKTTITVPQQESPPAHESEPVVLVQTEVLNNSNSNISSSNNSDSPEPEPEPERKPELELVSNPEPETVPQQEPESGQEQATEATQKPEAAPAGKSWASLFSKSDPSQSTSPQPTVAATTAAKTASKPLAMVTPYTPDAAETALLPAPSSQPAQKVPPTKSAPSSRPFPRKPASSDPNAVRLGEFLAKYTVDNRTVSLQPRGLTNRSNYCYINSILQALLACPPFYNLLKSLPLPARKAALKKSTSPIIESMLEFANEFSPLPAGARVGRKEKGSKKEETADIGCGPAFEPAWIYKILNGMRTDTFNVEGRQEDAEEFLGLLLNGMNDEMLDLMRLVDEGAAGLTNGAVNGDAHDSDEDEWKVMGPKNKGSITRRADFGRTPISDIFQGQLRSRVHRSGDHSTDNVQPFFTLQLDIERANSVRDALEILVNKDQLEGVTCSKTNQEVEAWQQVTIEELPSVLILHVKCFDYKLDTCSKIIKALEFPIDLKIDQKLLSSKTRFAGKQKQYKLFAVTYHDGKEASKGHYLTDAFHVGYNCWVRYDDASVKAIQESLLLHPHGNRVPYLLYYRRCDTIGNQQVTRKE